MTEIKIRMTEIKIRMTEIKIRMKIEKKEGMKKIKIDQIIKKEEKE